MRYVSAPSSLNLQCRRARGRPGVRRRPNPAPQSRPRASKAPKVQALAGHRELGASGLRPARRRARARARARPRLCTGACGPSRRPRTVRGPFPDGCCARGQEEALREDSNKPPRAPEAPSPPHPISHSHSLSDAVWFETLRHLRTSDCQSAFVKMKPQNPRGFGGRASEATGRGPVI